MNFTNRKNKLELISEGTNTNFLEDNIDKDLLFSLSDHQTERIERSISENMLIFPITRTIYKVVSLNENEENSEYRVVTRVPSCTCSDFLFRCDKDKKERCKHLWRIQLLSNINALPDSKTHPSKWMFVELQKDRLLLKSRGETELSDRVYTLQSQIMDHTPTTSNSYRKYFVEWLEIVRSIT